MIWGISRGTKARIQRIGCFCNGVWRDIFWAIGGFDDPTRSLESIP